MLKELLRLTTVVISPSNSTSRKVEFPHHPLIILFQLFRLSFLSCHRVEYICKIINIFVCMYVYTYTIYIFVYINYIYYLFCVSMIPIYVCIIYAERVVMFDRIQEFMRIFITHNHCLVYPWCMYVCTKDLLCLIKYLCAYFYLYFIPDFVYPWYLYVCLC